MAGDSKGAVFVAFAGNGSLTILKFIAFLLSGSGAMLSEAIHSFADTLNQLLLYIGIRRSNRPADRRFHYGYGSERYLFSLFSAIGIFVLGCGVTVYHGISSLLRPHELSLDIWTFVILGISLVVEAYVLWKAVLAVRAQKGNTPFWSFVRNSSDPTIVAIIFEDAVACLGVLVASLGIALSAWTENPMWDSISSILIGLMLGAVAVFLGLRIRELLLGPAIPGQLEADVIALLRSQETVTEVHHVKTRVVAAGRFRLTAEVDYDGRVLARRHIDWLKEQLARDGVDPIEITEEYGERVVDEVAREVDRLESLIEEHFPQLQWLDLESHLPRSN